MSVKTLKKQLIAAVAMVLVATIALGSSTFAWFANNASVTAKGMQVNAAAETSLVIKGKDSGEVFGSIGTTTLQRLTLHPTTSTDGLEFAKLGTDVKVEKAGVSAATWSGEAGAFTTGSSYTTGDLVTATNSGTDYYYLEAEYYLKSLNQDKTVYLKSFTLTTTSALKNAIRVSVTCNGITKVFNVGGGTAAKVGNKGTTAWELADAPTYAVAGKQASNFGSLTSNTEYPVTVRIWFEGQDADCYTDHIDANNTDMTIVFTTEQPAD